MALELHIDVDIDERKLTEAFEKLKDDKVMYEVHNLFAKMMNDYVPMYQGVLSQQYFIDQHAVYYPAPYAHYMYVGEVYGPNYPIKEGGEVVGYFTNPYGKKAPIIEGGVIVGWYSPPHKHPMGREIQYNKEMHPKASKEWDKAMMNEKGDEFLEKVKDILMQRCKELYG